MRFLFRKKRIISKGDMCTIKTMGTKNLPQIVMENNEVMYIGEFKKGTDIIAICSSIFASELIFIQKALLEKCKKQPSPLEKMMLMQMDSLIALKEISFFIKNGPVLTDNQNNFSIKFPEEDINFN